MPKIAPPPTPDPPPPPAPPLAVKTLIRVRHPGSHETGARVRFGDYSPGGVIYAVDAPPAERLLARGFERVPDATAPTPALISEE
mgnify:FL=1